MTACVNKHSNEGGRRHQRLAGRRALSLGIAPVAAMAESVDMLEVPSDAWDGVEFTWNISADKFGNYQVETGDEFMLTSAVDAFGDPVSMSNLTVIYYKDVNGDNALDANDLVGTPLQTPQGTTPYSSSTAGTTRASGRMAHASEAVCDRHQPRWTLSPSKLSVEAKSPRRRLRV